MSINDELKNYITTKILPIYQTFDKAHNIDHIKNVVKDSFLIYADLPQNLNPNMIFTIACYHDIGILMERKNHPKHSKKILLQDYNLHKWFTDEEIQIMAEAVEDHSSSLKTEPRSIYGKIVADADRTKNIETCIYRSLNFSLHYNPNATKEEHIEHAYTHLQEKYGENGYMKFWLKSSVNDAHLSEIRSYLNDREKFNKKLEEVIERNEVKF